MNTLLNSDNFNRMACRSASLLKRASDEANDLARQVMAGVRDSSQDFQHSTHSVSEKTVRYVHDEPVKSLLMAATAGAALMVIANLIMRSRDH